MVGEGYFHMARQLIWTTKATTAPVFSLVPDKQAALSSARELEIYKECFCFCVVMWLWLRLSTEKPFLLCFWIYIAMFFWYQKCKANFK